MNPLALISVTDKSGVVEFALGLQAKGFEILSTGQTAEFLRAGGVDVTNVSYYTGMPEILGGRVKTLHPKIHGALLAKPEDKQHQEELEELNIRPIEVLAVNLYPFEQTVLGGAPRVDVIESIDIGGPAMIRAAAKNADNVLVIVDPADYDEVLRKLEGKRINSLRRRLQAKAFAHTAFYDSLIAEYLSGDAPPAPGEPLTLGLRLAANLRYGENPQQSAGLYLRPFEQAGIAKAEQLWGKELSYNNLLDAEAAWELACDLYFVNEGERRPCAIVKHGSPCGAAWGHDAAASFELAKAGDPVSAFGGIVALPGRLDPAVAEAITQKGSFFEVIVCGSIPRDSLNVFQNRSGWGAEVRILTAGDPVSGGYVAVRSLRGGALVQTSDADDPVEWVNVTVRRPTPSNSFALKNAWTVAKHVKSNAIVVASEARVLGVGSGQPNRIQSVHLALQQAGEHARDAVLASDGFFPFPDSIEAAGEAGIAAVIQPGGSKRDLEVIETANRLGLAMVFTGVRHFRH